MGPAQLITKIVNSEVRIENYAAKVAGFSDFCKRNHL